MALYPGRENVAVALFNLVNGVVGSVVGVKTAARGLKHWADVDKAKRPALFQHQRSEPNERTYGGTIGIPALRTMHFEFWIYTGDAQEGSVIPATQINTMVDAIEVAMQGAAMTNVQTLGGLVTSARINGQVQYETIIRDSTSLAIVPIEVILP